MLEKIVQPLMLWYDKNKRILPWRKNRNAYDIWISEIMLQQTRVEAVKPFFQRFKEALPRIEDLAECPEDRLLKLWEGLGYYNRVRNMQKAAIQVVEKFDGKLPDDYEALKSLSGIGNYTAGAIASIAYGIPVPAVDGNVLRVLARIREDDRDIMKQSVRSQVEADLLKVMPSEHPGIFNQALMELGATVCVPNGMAHCEVCPVAEFCKARESQRVLDFPVKTKAKARRIEDRTILVIMDGEHIAIQKRPKKGLLAGLYEFPNLEGHLTEEEVLEQVEGYGLTSLRIQPLPNSKHIFSHVEWHMIGYAVRVAALEHPSTQKMLFVEVEHAEEKYPVPAAYSAYAGYMNLRLGQEKFEEM
ncbi:MAG TPA: A/G-specific adenine glycosylase [Candidatus Pelethocola excrementipullorum]|nr:A/G-specific adenine glycosylase [Candidatus Pelethocola excrementipullorum]